MRSTRSAPAASVAIAGQRTARVSSSTQAGTLQYGTRHGEPDDFDCGVDRPCAAAASRIPTSSPISRSASSSRCSESFRRKLIATRGGRSGGATSHSEGRHVRPVPRRNSDLSRSTSRPSAGRCATARLLAISQNTALFSLLGTNYGGNGRSTFGLPNLQGSVPVDQVRGRDCRLISWASPAARQPSR